MQYFVVGINHQSAPLHIRERLAFPPEGLPSALESLLERSEVEEGFILSTCNRVEVYAACAQAPQGIAAVTDFLVAHRNLNLPEIEPHLYKYSNLEAVRHGFRVAASLDSMVLGETQIMGQVKKAYEQALGANASGVFLHRFMHRAIDVAKKVRTETELFSKAVSVGSTGVILAKNIFGDLKNKKIVLLGAGKISTLVLTYLQEEGAERISIFNRSLKRLEVGEKTFESQPLENCESALVEADVVITSLGGEIPFLSHEKMKSLMEARKNRLLFVIDLGVPRNVDPAAASLENIYLYNTDDLQSVVAENRKSREQEAKKAEAIVEKEAFLFYQSMVTHEPTIAELSRKFQNIGSREIEKTLKKMAHLSLQDQEALKRCTQAIVTRILHDPILVLRSNQTTEENWDAPQILRKLFRLEEENSK